LYAVGFTEDYELLSDRLDGNADVEVNDGEEPEEEFEAYFDPLNEVDLKVRRSAFALGGVV